jgi:hypothetical protein
MESLKEKQHTTILSSKTLIANLIHVMSDPDNLSILVIGMPMS